MKVLWLANAFDVGGAEQLTLEIVRGLRGTVSFEFVLLKSEGRLADELRALGAPIHAGFLRHKYDVLALPRILRALAGVRADVLHVEPGLNALLVGRGLAPRLGVRSCVTAMHTTGRWGRERALGPVTRILVNRLDGIVACAETQRGYLTATEGLRDDRIRVIFNGVDHERFRPWAQGGVRPRPEGLETGEKAVGIVASLTPEKGHDVFVRAAALALREAPEARFLSMGQGPQRAVIERLIAELGVGRQVRLLGVRRDLPDLLPLLDLQVLSSYPYRETLPISTMEGMACGLPVVNTDVGSVRDLVVDGEHGFIVPPGDPEALAAAMVRVLRDDGLRARLGAAARRRIEERFTLARAVREYGDYYREMARTR